MSRAQHLTHTKQGKEGFSRNYLKSEEELGEKGVKSMPCRGKSICKNQDRGECGAFAHKKEVSEGWGAENQMGM